MTIYSLIIIFSSLLISGGVYLLISKVDWKKVNWIKILPKKNKLIFYREYTHYGSYHNSTRFKNEFIETILYRFKQESSPNNYISISSKFNNKNYPFFDLDSEEDLELFKKIYSNKSYVIYCSSTNNDTSTTTIRTAPSNSGSTTTNINPDEKTHYWGILDVPYKNVKDILLDTNWKVCNDSKYVSFAKSQNLLLIRGLYENRYRKPALYETQGNLSGNFKLFIDTLEKFYKTDGFELSILRYKNPDMLLQFNRKQKLNEINGFFI